MILISTALFICAVAFYIYSLKTLKKAKYINTIRNNIAQDLHDDVGATLSSISFYAQAVKQRMNSNKLADAELILNQMADSARDTVENMGDIVWMVNPKNDTLTNLIQKLEAYANKILSAKNIDFELSSNINQVSNMDMLLRRDLYLIGKEAINNIAKYSGATSAQINVNLHSKYLELEIKDNGVGFDSGADTHGNGLLNMKVRANNIGAIYQLNSIMNKGTHITLKVKLY